MKKVFNSKTGACLEATDTEIAHLMELLELHPSSRGPHGDLVIRTNSDFDLAAYALEGLRRGQKARLL